MALLVLLVAVVSFVFPSSMGWIPTSSINWMLGLVMFGMGLTINPVEFKIIFTRPRDVIVGFFAQFTLMPLLAWLLTRLFQLPPELAIGVILVGACPGGTASNVITYLAGGDLALSVGMTGVSTIFAPLLTPLITYLLADTMVDVNMMGMLLSILQIVILPILAGLLIRHFFPRFTEMITQYLPTFSSLVIMAIVGCVVSRNSAQLHSVGLLIIIVVMLHNVCGFALGFLVGKLLRLSHPKCSAISIEVGMQNSGLACSLAQQHFSALQAATVPGAIFSVWHNIAGSLWAHVLRNMKETPTK